MSSISDLGNGSGYVYITDTSSNIISNVPNFPESVGGIIAVANTASPITGEVLATVLYTFAGAGPGNIQLTTNVHGLVATGLWGGTLAATVSNLAAAISASIQGYEAVADGLSITMSAPTGTGAAGNAYIANVSASGGISVLPGNIQAFAGGISAGGLYGTTGNGKRFYINSLPGALEGTIVGATEITGQIIPRPSTASIYSQNSTIAGGTAPITRISNISIVFPDTEAAAASDDLDNISTAGFSDGDVIMLKSNNAARIKNIRFVGNIVLANGTDFALQATSDSIILQYSASLNKWTEVSRSPGLDFSVASQRAQGIPYAVPGTTDVVMPTSGTLNVEAGVDTGVQIITGSPAMVANYAITPIGTPLDGDRFEIVWNATPTTGANTVTVFGKTLTAEQVQAKATILAVYDLATTTWEATLITDGFATTYATAASVTAGLALKQDDLGFPATNGSLLARDLVGNPYWITSPVGTVFNASITISAVQMATLNTSAQILIPNPGAGFAIQPIGHVFGQRLYGTTPYATATNFGVRYTGAGTNVYTSTAGLMTGAGNQSECINFLSATDFAPVANVAMEIFAVGGNPTLGDSQYQFTVLYTIVPLI